MNIEEIIAQLPSVEVTKGLHALFEHNQIRDLCFSILNWRNQPISNSSNLDKINEKYTLLINDPKNNEELENAKLYLALAKEEYRRIKDEVRYKSSVVTMYEIMEKFGWKRYSLGRPDFEDQESIIEFIGTESECSSFLAKTKLVIDAS